MRQSISYCLDDVCLQRMFLNSEPWITWQIAFIISIFIVSVGFCYDSYQRYKYLSLQAKLDYLMDEEEEEVDNA